MLYTCLYFSLIITDFLCPEKDWICIRLFLIMFAFGISDTAALNVMTQFLYEHQTLSTTLFSYWGLVLS